MPGPRFDDLLKRGGKVQAAGGAPRFDDLVQRGGKLDSAGGGGAGGGGAQLAPPAEERTPEVPRADGLEGAISRAAGASNAMALGPLYGLGTMAAAAVNGYRGEAPGAIEQGGKDLAAGAEQGATFGHADELKGVVGSFTGGGYEATRDRARVDYGEAQKRSPGLYGAGELAGATLATGGVGRVTGLARAGQAATGAGGVLTRVMAAMGLGGLAGAAAGEGSSNAELGSEQHLADTAKGGAWGAAAGGAGQLVLGEPIRAAGGAVARKIASSDQAISDAAEAEIASAKGKAGKQVQEAVGGLENLHHADEIAANAPTHVPARAPRGAPVGLPPDARLGDPLYHVQGLAPDEAQRFLEQQFRMTPEAAADFVANEAAPFLKQAAQAAPRAPRGAGEAVMRKHGAGVVEDLLARRVGNADEKIADFVNNPVKVPGRGTAMRNAMAGAKEQAAGEMRRGAAQAAFGAAVAKVPVIGPAIGGYNVAKGIGRVVRGAYAHPAVLNRLRSIPGAGRAIAAAAGKGSVALETVLFSMSRDPAVAAELEAIDGELAGQQVAEEE